MRKWDRTFNRATPRNNNVSRRYQTKAIMDEIARYLRVFLIDFLKANRRAGQSRILFTYSTVFLRDISLIANRKWEYAPACSTSTSSNCVRTYVPYRLSSVQYSRYEWNQIQLTDRLHDVNEWEQWKRTLNITPWKEQLHAKERAYLMLSQIRNNVYHMNNKETKLK